MSAEEVEAEWEKTRDIDNPLNPWVQVYKGELKLEEGAHFHDRPALDIVIRKFRAAKLTAYIAGLLFTVLFVCVWPGSMLSIDVMSGFGFLVWTTLSRCWAFVASTFIIVVPLVQEVVAIWRQHNSNQREKARQNEISSQASTSAAGSKKGTLAWQKHAKLFSSIFCDVLLQNICSSSTYICGNRVIECTYRRYPAE